MEQIDELPRYEAVIVYKFDPATRVRLNLVQDYELRRGDNSFSEPDAKFPGGMSETGENSGDAAVRELFEETGLVIRREARKHLRVIYDQVEDGVRRVFYEIQFKHCGGRIRTDVVEDRKSRLSNRRFLPEGNDLSKSLHELHRDPYKVTVPKPRTSGPRLALAG